MRSSESACLQSPSGLRDCHSVDFCERIVGVLDLVLSSNEGCTTKTSPSAVVSNPQPSLAIRESSRTTLSSVGAAFVCEGGVLLVMTLGSIFETARYVQSTCCQGSSSDVSVLRL